MENLVKSLGVTVLWLLAVVGGSLVGVAIARWGGTAGIAATMVVGFLLMWGLNYARSTEKL